MWHDRNMWVLDKKVFDQICDLAEKNEGNVQREAAYVLAGTPSPDRIPSSSVLALAKVACDSDLEVTLRVNALLRKVLGEGPQTNDLETARAFWKNWTQREWSRVQSDMARFEQGQTSSGTSVGGASVLGVAGGVRQSWTAKGRMCQSLEGSLRDIQGRQFPPNERSVCWLLPLMYMAGREEFKSVQGEAALLLLEVARGQDPVLRLSALGQFGNLPGCLSRGSACRVVLDHALNDDKVPPEEGAEAAWSLRTVIQGDSELVEQLLAFAQRLKNLPENAFTKLPRAVCIGRVQVGLSEWAKKDLSPDPGEWRQELQGLLPQKK